MNPIVTFLFLLGICEHCKGLPVGDNVPVYNEADPYGSYMTNYWTNYGKNKSDLVENEYQDQS